NIIGTKPGLTMGTTEQNEAEKAVKRNLLHDAERSTKEAISNVVSAMSCIDPLQANGIGLPLMRALQQLRTANDLITEELAK
ncbi:MAG: hypothetical protein PHG61_06525, partial [Candidatus Marinimicrobia bacterium]|nr:hypothetical protein [Candidatus Neomarinimicrobiota bacterium]